MTSKCIAAFQHLPLCLWVRPNGFSESIALDVVVGGWIRQQAPQEVCSLFECSKSVRFVHLLSCFISGWVNDSRNVDQHANINFHASPLSPLEWRWLNWCAAPVEQNRLNDNTFLSHLELNWLPESLRLKSADRMTSLVWKRFASDGACSVYSAATRASVIHIHR